MSTLIALETAELGMFLRSCGEFHLLDEAIGQLRHPLEITRLRKEQLLLRVAASADAQGLVIFAHISGSS